MPSLNLSGEWRFRGQGDGDPVVRHRVVLVDHEQTVITWSRFLSDDTGVGGWSWMGPFDDFTKQFVKA